MSETLTTMQKPSMMSRKVLNYSERQMEMALEAVEGGMAKRVASRTFGVPKTTLLDKIMGRSPRERKIGHPPILTADEENSIVEWVKHQTKRGLPPKMDDILNSVERLIIEAPRPNPFLKNRPGPTWWKLFRGRHKELSIRVPERVSKARAGITEASIREWFIRLEEDLKSIGHEDILQDPARIFNSDESNVQLSDKTGNVVAPKGWRNVYEIAPGTEKSTLTFLGTFCANGDVVAPTLIFPYVRLPRDIADSVPEDFFIATSESGWMTAPVFFEFVCNAFDKWLTDHHVKRPVLLFVDGHSSHLTMQLSVRSEELGILIYLLPPNTTHIMQPADVGVFKPFKSNWRKELRNFQRENLGQSIRRKDVGKFVKKCLELIKPETIKNSFKATGLFPFNPENVDYTKCLDIAIEGEEPASDITNDETPYNVSDYKLALKVVKSELGEIAYNDIVSNDSHPTFNLIKSLFNKSGQTFPIATEIISSPSITSFPSVSAIEISYNEDQEILIDAFQEIQSNLEKNLPVPIENENALSNVLTCKNSDSRLVNMRLPVTPPKLTRAERIMNEDTPPYKNDSDISNNASPSEKIIDITDSTIIEVINFAPSAKNSDDSGSLATDNLQEKEKKGKSQNLLSQVLEAASLQESNIPSTSWGKRKRQTGLEDHIFWEGKMPYKKCKPQKEQSPALLSSKNYKKYLIEKESKKVTKKLSEWICIYCGLAYLDDKAKKLAKRWVECDGCRKHQHVQCIPSKHKDHFDLETENEDEFHCENCFRILNE